MPKLVVAALLEPAWHTPGGLRLQVREKPIEQLLAELALHEIDVVLSDAPAPSGTGVKIYTHLLGECGVSFFAAPELAARLKPGFPASLNGAAMLLPMAGHTLRRGLDTWFVTSGLRPMVAGEFEDSALLKACGQRGHGVFPAAAVTEADVVRQYGVVALGRIDEVKERFYAITAERKMKHPAVLAIAAAARSELLGG